MTEETNSTAPAVAVNIANKRRRGKEIASFHMVPTPPQMNLFPSPSTIQYPSYMNEPPLQLQTGLPLSSFNDVNNKSQNQEEDLLCSIINQNNLEIEQYLIFQGEQLRLTLAEKQRAHCRALLAAVEENTARKLKEKEFEMNRLAKKNALLERHMDRLRTVTQTWQEKALSARSLVESLQAQIGQASKKPDRADVGSGAAVEDAESAFIDPNRGEERRRTCRVCGTAEVTVVVLPCRHFCMCVSCDAAQNAVLCCPVCHGIKSGSVQVRLS